jgi:hypothetical protein
MASKSHVSMMGWTMAANSEGGRYPWLYRKNNSECNETI